MIDDEANLAYDSFFALAMRKPENFVVPVVLKLQ